METASRKMPPFGPPTVSSNARVADVPVAASVMLKGVQSRPEVVDVPWLIDWFSRVAAPLVIATSAENGPGTPVTGLFA